MVPLGHYIRRTVCTCARRTVCSRLLHTLHAALRLYCSNPVSTLATMCSDLFDIFWVAVWQHSHQHQLGYGFFCRHPLQSVSAQRRSGSHSPSSPHQSFLANLVNGTSSSTASSINPWASPTQHSNLLKSRRTSTLGNRSRNGSAALSELTRLRSMCASDESVPDDVPVSSSM